MCRKRRSSRWASRWHYLIQECDLPLSLTRETCALEPFLQDRQPKDSPCWSLRQRKIDNNPTHHAFLLAIKRANPHQQQGHQIFQHLRTQEANRTGQPIACTLHGHCPRKHQVQHQLFGGRYLQSYQHLALIKVHFILVGRYSLLYLGL